MSQHTNYKIGASDVLSREKRLIVIIVRVSLRSETLTIIIL